MTYLSFPKGCLLCLLSLVVAVLMIIERCKSKIRAPRLQNYSFTQITIASATLPPFPLASPPSDRLLHFPQKKLSFVILNTFFVLIHHNLYRYQLVSVSNTFYLELPSLNTEAPKLIQAAARDRKFPGHQKICSTKTLKEAGCRRPGFVRKEDPGDGSVHGE